MGFCPLERLAIGIVGFDETVNSAAPPGWQGGGALQGMTAEPGEPDFDLVEPGRTAWRVVEMHVAVADGSAIVRGLVGVQMLQDFMDLAVAVLGEDLILEPQKLDAPAAPGARAGPFQRVKPGGGDVSSLARTRRSGLRSVQGLLAAARGVVQPCLPGLGETLTPIANHGFPAAQRLCDVFPATAFCQ